MRVAALLFSSIPDFHHSGFPLFHHSGFPLFQHPPFPGEAP